MLLSDVPTRGRARVVTLSVRGGHWRRLMALGIRPGASIVVEQRFPSLVVRVGQTRVALDHAAAALVEVEQDENSST